MKEKLKGMWRTYKLFYFSGKLEHHHEHFYTELSVAEDLSLSFHHSQTKREAVLFKPEDWIIETQKNHPFLFFGKRKMFELITIEAEDLVLVNVLSGEKLFFARMPEWSKRIQPTGSPTWHIAPDKEEKETQ